MKQTEKFIKALRAYLVDADLNAADWKTIGSIFDRYANTVHKEIEKVNLVKTISIKAVTQDGDIVSTKNFDIPPDDILDFVRDKTGVTDITTNTTRVDSLTDARFFAMFLLHSFSSLTTVHIGRKFASKTRPSGFHHTSVIYGRDRGRELITNNVKYIEYYEQFKSAFGITERTDFIRIGADAGVLRSAV